MQTNFDKVLQFNTIFGAKIHSIPQHNIFEEDPDLVKHRLDLITEELNETIEAVKNKDLREVVDGLCDLLYVTEGMLSALGINGNKAFDLVHQSNLSKLCVNEDEAKLSVEKYKEENRYKEPAYKRSVDGNYFIVYDKATSKILKSINYLPVNLDPVL